MISKSTIIRTAVLCVALANQILTCFNIYPLPFKDDDVSMIISTIFTIVTSVINWWKNNSFTAGAIIGDSVMMDIKENSHNEDQ